MGLSYVVKKNKHGRWAFRGLGFIFAILGVLGVVLTFRVQYMRFFVLAVALVAAFYGFYLIKSSFRLQAYDITYEFTEEHVKIIHHRGQQIITYDCVEEAQYIEPSPDVDYVLIKLVTNERKYVLHFNNQKEFAKKIHAYLLARIPEV